MKNARATLPSAALIGGRHRSGPSVSSRWTAPRARCGRVCTSRRADRCGSRADDVVPPRGWLDVRRPREPRSRVPVPGRESGVQLLAIDYRLAPEHQFPAAVEDSQAAFRWLVDHAEEVNADPYPAGRGRRLGRRVAVAVDGGLGCREGPPDGLPAVDLPRRGLRRANREPSSLRRGLRADRRFMTGAEEAYFTAGADKAHPDASAIRRLEFPAGIAPAHIVTAGYDPLRDEARHSPPFRGQRRRGDGGQPSVDDPRLRPRVGAGREARRTSRRWRTACAARSA